MSCQSPLRFFICFVPPLLTRDSPLMPNSRPPCTRLRRCSSSISYEDAPLSQFLRRPRAYNSLGLNLPLFGSYTGIETSIIPLSIMKSRSLISANITSSRSIVFLSLTLVTRKHRYLPGTCATEVARPFLPVPVSV